MKDAAWDRVDKLFHASVELDAVHRAAFLDIACAGDQSLRSEVESLLTADSDECDLIDTPALESAIVLLEDDQPRLSPGEQVGHYEIVRLVGKGGMGEVYLARDRILNRNIALKLLLFYYTQNEDRLRRFQREAQTVSALNHPNIITIHELGSVNDQQFIATEFIEGETLRASIKRGPVSLSDAIDIAIQIAGAIAAAHKAGIVHRDIKPENIILRPDGYVKVVDFGLAKLAEESESKLWPTDGEPADISSGLVMGTLRYMSPEQASGIPVDARSDIFSLGLVLYEMVAPQPLFHENDPAHRAGSIFDGGLPGINGDEIPHPLRAVFAKMLDKDRELRYQHADELVTDLKIIKQKLEREAKNVAPSTRWQQKSVYALVIVLAFASVIGYAVFKFFRSGAETAVAETFKQAGGTWASKAPISSARWQAEPAVLNGVLYVAGGWNVCTPFSNLESYDPETDSWTQRAPMLTARGGHGVGVLNGKLYAVGGSVNCGEHISNVEAYEPETDRWTERAPLPTARFGPSVAVANGRLYAIGGKPSEGDGYLRSNTEYDPQSDSWIERAPIPTPRSAAAAAVVNGIIYVIGGAGESGTLASVEAYDPATDSWTTKRSMLMPRVSFAASEVAGIIYAFGGSGNRIEVEAYDPAADTWTVVAKMPTRAAHFHAVTLNGSIYFAGGSNGASYLSAVMAYTPERTVAYGETMCPSLLATSKTVMPTRRSNMTVGEIGGIIYAVGGYENSARYLATNEAYDPGADKWTSKAPLPGARETRGTNNAVVDGKLYVIGGNARGTCSNLSQAYDPVTDSWITKAPMPTPRCHLAVIAVNGLIYALGGTNTNGSIEYSTLEIYDPSNDSWIAGPNMPSPRQDLGAVSLNGVIYAVGGGNPALTPTGELGVLEAYDPVNSTWTTKAPMPTPRMAFAAAVLNGMLIVIGGRNNDTGLATVEAYDPGTDTWRILTSISAARSFLSAVTVNNTIYALGGNGTIANSSLQSNDAFNMAPCPSK